MRLIALLILAFLLPLRSQAHPLHLSITNITYENGKLNIRLKTFRDDWEVGYFHYHSQPVDFTDPAQRKLPWFNKYLVERFRISETQEGPHLALVVDSVGLAEDAMTIEMHAILPSEPNSLYIYNALLIDIYPDQTNLVIFGIGKRETGIKFDVRKQDAEVILR
jgi:hypothetical protein